MRRPNILVIMSDEHDPAIAGPYGNALVRTPNLDRLAGAGVTFEGAYCNSPLCVPSRLSFTAGKYVSRIAAWHNHAELPRPDYPSLPRAMNAAGYASFLCGKQHYAHDRRYGFTEIGGNYNNHAKHGRTARREPDDFDSPGGLSERFDDFHPGDDSPVLRKDRGVTAGVVSFLRNRDPDERPFFLFAGYLAPHFPLIVPENYWRRYEGRVPPPIIPEGHLAAQPRNYRHLRAGFRALDVPPAIAQRGRELYYGLTEWLDHEIGQVLDALAGSALADDTVVIYTSDHGENLGEHGLWWKNSVYEHAARVPLIVSWPARWAGGQRRAGACALVDLVRTIADLGGAAAPDDWDGDSLLPWLDNPAHGWKDLAVSEYYAHNIASGYAMLRAGRYKYVYHTAAGDRHPPERELYDLQADPGEFTNLAMHPTHQTLIARLHATLLAELGEDPEATERRCRADSNAAVDAPAAR